MHADPKGSTAMSQQLMVPAADTRLYTVDAPGGTPALLSDRDQQMAADDERRSM